MKIVIAYPPLKGPQNTSPLLGQNRQFQWAHQYWAAYPMVPASAATLLKSLGHQVLWLDGIAQNWSYQTWLEKLKNFQPDLVFLETKTPVVKQHWQIIKDLKKIYPHLLTVLAGDHISALPEESFKYSPVDYCLTGGDWDFLLKNLVEHLDHPDHPQKNKKLAPGIYYRSGKEIKNTGHFKLSHNLEKLPPIDRDLTCWRLYSRKNSNYRRYPGTYSMFARDCWWGRCTFCSWTTLFPGKNCRTISVTKALDEIGSLIKKYHIREIMDDSGTFPVGDWLKNFCLGMIKRGYHQKLKISCNMRFNNSLTQADYHLMKQAGFRFLLFGLESANQKTLDRLHKNLKITKVIPALEKAKKAGLNPHLTVMVGYPWESQKELENTYQFVRHLTQKGLVDSLQATIVIPYPGTPLFQKAKEKKLLQTTNWNDFDMSRPVLKTPISSQTLLNYVRRFYSLSLTPRFLLRKLFEGLSSPENFFYYTRLALKIPARLLDFSSEK